MTETNRIIARTSPELDEKFEELSKKYHVNRSAVVNKLVKEWIEAFERDPIAAMVACLKEDLVVSKEMDKALRGNADAILAWMRSLEK